MAQSKTEFSPAKFSIRMATARTVPIDSTQSFKETCRNIVDAYIPDWKIRSTKVPPIFSPAVRSLERIALLSSKKAEEKQRSVSEAAASKPAKLSKQERTANRKQNRKLKKAQAKEGSQRPPDDAEKECSADSAPVTPPREKPANIEAVFGFTEASVTKLMKEEEGLLRASKAEHQLFQLMSSVAETPGENLKVISGFNLTKNNWINRLASLSAHAEELLGRFLIEKEPKSQKSPDDEGRDTEEEKHKKNREMDLLVIDMNRRRVLIFEVKNPVENLREDDTELVKSKEKVSKPVNKARNQLKDSQELLLDLFRSMEIYSEDNLLFQRVIALPFHHTHLLDPIRTPGLFLIGTSECTNSSAFKNWWNSSAINIRGIHGEQQAFEDISSLLVSVASLALDRDTREQMGCYVVTPGSFRISDEAAAVEREVENVARSHSLVVDYLTQNKSLPETTMFYLVPEQLEAFHGKKYQLFYGPQGSGKTLLFIQKIVQLMNAGERVLLVAPENLIYFSLLKIKKNVPQSSYDLLVGITPVKLSDQWQYTNGSWNIFVDELDILLGGSFSVLLQRLIERMTINFFQKKEQQKYCWLACSYIENPTALYHTYLCFDRTLLSNVMRSTVDHMKTMKLYGTIDSPIVSRPSESLPYPWKTDPWPKLYHTFHGHCRMTILSDAEDMDVFISRAAKEILRTLSSLGSQELEAAIGIPLNLFGRIAVLTLSKTVASKLRYLLSQKITCAEKHLKAVSDIKYQLTEAQSLIAVDSADSARGLDWPFVIIIWEGHPEFRNVQGFEMLQYMLGRSSFYAHIIACYDIARYQMLTTMTLDHNFHRSILMIISVSWFAFNTIRKYFCDLAWNPTSTNAVNAMQRALVLKNLIKSMRNQVLQYRNLQPAAKGLAELIIKTVENTVTRFENKLHLMPLAGEKEEADIVNDALFAFEESEIAFNGALRKGIEGNNELYKNPTYVKSYYEEMMQTFDRFEKEGVFDKVDQSGEPQKSKEQLKQLKELVQKLLNKAQSAANLATKSGCPEDMRF